MKKILSLDFFIFIFLILLSLPAILPFFHKGYFPTHDGEWTVVRLSEMFREIKDLQFPARFSGNLNFGYGYPLFNFVYPIPYYIGLILHFLKINFVDSIKILFAISVPLSALLIFLLSKEMWKSKIAGVVSAIFYIYLPYRFVDLYVRGSLGESLSFALFPLIFYCAIKISKNPKSKYLMPLGALSYAILITTHNIMAVFFTIIFVSFLFFQFIQNKKDAVFKLLPILVFGLGLSSFFWIPAILEKNNILLSVIPIADRNLYFVNPLQFILSSWGYGVPTERGGFSYQLGWPLLIVFILTIAYLFFLKIRKKEKNDLFKNAWFLVFLSLFLIFFLFSPSRFFWKLPLLSEINYPWTMLLPIGFLTSLLSGYLIIQKSKIKFVPIFLAIASIIIFLPYAKPQYYVDRGEGFYFTNDATTTSSSELMPLWVKKFPSVRSKEKVEIVKGQGEISNLSYNSKKISFNISSQTESKIRVNTIYYPGWKALIDNKESIIAYNNDQGLMELSVPKGNHNISFYFSETPLRLFADIISVLSIIFLLLIKFYRFR